MLNSVLFCIFLFLLFIAIYGKQLGYKLGTSNGNNILRPVNNSGIEFVIKFCLVLKQFVRKSTINQESKACYVGSDGSVAGCAPLETLDQLNQFVSIHRNSPPTELHVSPNIVKHNSSSTCPKLLVCHDMKGGYLEDTALQGDKLNNHFEIYNWHIIDVFIYFSHKLITIPPENWVRQCRRYGVKVLGTFITEWQIGEDICRNSIFSSPESAISFADDLCLVGRHYHIDGWFVNLENPCIGLTSVILIFLKRLKANGMYVLWYDSVITSGELEWQNRLCSKNLPFFEASDGIFINYSWEKAEPGHSGAKADEYVNKRRRYDVFFGIDVFGRGTASAGGYDTSKAIDLLLRSGVSTAIFAPGWLYEKTCTDLSTSTIDMFWHCQLKFWRLVEQAWSKEALRWSSLERMMNNNKKRSRIEAIEGKTTLYSSIDLFASFSIGMGHKSSLFYLSGYLISAQDGWFNPSLANFGPINLTAFNDNVVSVLPKSNAKFKEYNNRNSKISCRSRLLNNVSFNGTSCLSVEIYDLAVPVIVESKAESVNDNDASGNKANDDDDDAAVNDDRGRGIFHVPLFGYNDGSVSIPSDTDGPSIYATLPAPWPRCSRCFVRVTFAIQVAEIELTRDPIDVCFKLNVEPRACSDVLVREVVLSSCRRIQFNSGHLMPVKRGQTVPDRAGVRSYPSLSSSSPLIPDEFAKTQSICYYNNQVQSDVKCVMVDVKAEKNDDCLKEEMELRVDCNSVVAPHILSNMIGHECIQVKLQASKDELWSDYINHVSVGDCRRVSGISEANLGQSFDAASSVSKKTGIVVLDKENSAEKALTPSVAIKFAPLLHIQHFNMPPCEEAFPATTPWISVLYALPDTLGTWIRTIKSLDLVVVSMTCPSSSCRVLLDCVSISNNYDSQSCDFDIKTRAIPSDDKVHCFKPALNQLQEHVVITRHEENKLEFSLHESSSCSMLCIDVFQRLDDHLFWHGRWCNLSNGFMASPLSASRVSFVLQSISTAGVRVPIEFCDEFIVSL